MKKTLIILVAVLAVVVLYSLNVYNKAVSLDENVKAAWSGVLNQYERRSDLIPNLVATVKGYAGHESKVLTDVVEKRAQALQMRITADDLSDAQKMTAFQKAQSELGGALSRLLAVAENYPDLKANQNFLALQSQLEGTENRIAVARKDYIDILKQYNMLLRKVPAKWVLAIFGDFEKRAEYSIDESKKAVPAVSFD